MWKETNTALRKFINWNLRIKMQDQQRIIETHERVVDGRLKFFNRYPRNRNGRLPSERNAAIGGRAY